MSYWKVVFFSKFIIFYFALAFFVVHVKNYKEYNYFGLKDTSKKIKLFDKIAYKLLLKYAACKTSNALFEIYYLFFINAKKYKNLNRN